MQAAAITLLATVKLYTIISFCYYKTAHAAYYYHWSATIAIINEYKHSLARTSLIKVSVMVSEGMFVNII